MECHQFVNEPVRRTSTPVFDKSSNKNQDPYYGAFRDKLSTPMKKACMRGVYGPKQGLINGHFAMEPIVYTVRNYTCVIAFSWNISESSDESSYATVPSGSIYSSPLKQMPGVFNSALQYSTYKVHYHKIPTVQDIPQQDPMFCLPIKYL